MKTTTAYDRPAHFNKLCDENKVGSEGAYDIFDLTDYSLKENQYSSNKGEEPKSIKIFIRKRNGKEDAILFNSMKEALAYIDKQKVVVEVITKDEIDKIVKEEVKEFMDWVEEGNLTDKIYQAIKNNGYKVFELDTNKNIDGRNLFLENLIMYSFGLKFGSVIVKNIFGIWHKKRPAIGLKIDKTKRYS